MRTEQIEIFTFAELSPEAQERAIERWRNRGEFFHDFVIEEWNDILRACGWSEVEINYSGFCSQGDGASFTGRFDGREIDEAKFRQYFEPNSDSDWILVGFIEYESCSAKLRRTSRHYSHENTVGVDWMEEATGDDFVTVESTATEDDFLSHCRAVMREIYRALEREYDWQMSDEYIRESIEANELEFLATGEIY